MSTNIYILKLQRGHYYVGKSDNPMKRYQEHLSGKGSAWTKHYKPNGIEKIISNASPFDEDRYVKEYMAKYGMDKVRGGSYVTEELSEFQEEALKMELWSAKDKCTRCGRAGHWIKDCYAKTDTTGKELEEESDEESWDLSEDDFEEVSEDEGCMCAVCKKKFTSDAAFRKHTCRDSPSKGKCYRCGRPGHYAPDCYASRHIKGYELDE